jgi:hypothetical protein
MKMRKLMDGRAGEIIDQGRGGGVAGGRKCGRVGGTHPFPMPEAFAVLAVFAISVAAYVNGLLKARDPSLRTPAREIERLERQAEWLEQRLDQARREKWGVVMAERISAELGATLEELAARRRELREGARAEVSRGQTM